MERHTDPKSQTARMQDQPTTKDHFLGLDMILRAKLKGIPPSVTLNLDIEDICQMSTKCCEINVPPDIDLAWLLANSTLFDGVSTDNLPLPMVRAIWYYSMDRLHSWDPHWPETRVRVLLLLVHNARFADEPFDRLYLDAWYEFLQRSTEFEARERFLESWRDETGRPSDLLQFAPEQVRKMARVFQHLSSNPKMRRNVRTLLMEMANDTSTSRPARPYRREAIELYSNLLRGFPMPQIPNVQYLPRTVPYEHNRYLRALLTLKQAPLAGTPSNSAIPLDVYVRTEVCIETFMACDVRDIILAVEKFLHDREHGVGIPEDVRRLSLEEHGISS